MRGAMPSDRRRARCRPAKQRGRKISRAGIDAFAMALPVENRIVPCEGLCFLEAGVELNCSLDRLVPKQLAYWFVLPRVLRQYPAKCRKRCIFITNPVWSAMNDVICVLSCAGGFCLQLRKMKEAAQFSLRSSGRYRSRWTSSTAMIEAGSL